MKLTIDLPALLAKVQARRQRWRDLQARGVLRFPPPRPAPPVIDYALPDHDAEIPARPHED